DILPGSSIKEVYDDSKEEYEKILSENKEMTGNSLGSLTAKIQAPRHAVVVFNPNSAEVPGIVSFTCPAEIKNPVLWDQEEQVAVQKTAQGDYVFTAKGVPSKGYKTYILKEGDGGEASSM